MNNTPREIGQCPCGGTLDRTPSGGVCQACGKLWCITDREWAKIKRRAKNATELAGLPKARKLQYVALRDGESTPTAWAIDGLPGLFVFGRVGGEEIVAVHNGRRVTLTPWTKANEEIRKAMGEV